MLFAGQTVQKGRRIPRWEGNEAAFGRYWPLTDEQTGKNTSLIWVWEMIGLSIDALNSF